MRIVVMGTGGIGGYFGARLAQGGSEVTFIARGAHLTAILENGLRVASALGDIHLPHPKVSENPAEAGPADLVLLGVKRWDTEAAARALKPLTDAGAAIVSFQNGVQKDEVLRGILGEGGLPPAMTSSMHKDLEKGNRLEVQWLSGDIVRRGQVANVPIPVNRAMADILALHAGGGRG
jgi:ketopantoate reductase